MKVNKSVFVMMIVAAVVLMGCANPAMPEPEPEPVKVSVSGVEFTNVTDLTVTGIYQWDGTGTYYFDDGIEVVGYSTDCLFVNNKTFVNNKYLSGRVYDNTAASAWSAITTKYWLKNISGTDRKLWLVTNDDASDGNPVGVIWSLIDSSNILGGETWAFPIDYFYAPTDEIGWNE